MIDICISTEFVEFHLTAGEVQFWSYVQYSLHTSFESWNETNRIFTTNWVSVLVTRDYDTRLDICMAAMLMCCRRTDHRLWSECLSNECRHGPDGWSDTQSLQSPLLLAVPTRLLHSGHYTRYFFYFSILCYMQFSWRTSDFYWCFLLLCKICWDDEDFMFLTCLCSWFIYGSHSPGKSGN